MAYETSVPYRAGDDSRTAFRIPAVVRARSGALLAFAEGRRHLAAELPGGTLHLVTRDQAPAARRRAAARSADGGARLTTPFRPQAGATGPARQGRPLSLDGHGTLPHSGPADPAARARMTVRADRHHGRARRPVHTVSGRPAAYGALVRTGPATVGPRRETGDVSAYATLTFRRIPVEDLL
ncbi:hypothetical protein ACGH2B_20780 [Streptomyces sp. BBFR2]|uniref:hypothetical protein n=1 Tax=Streptomyces sp. BBFR2 TaxID=3372854 RepID=UPI0037DA5710